MQARQQSVKVCILGICLFTLLSLTADLPLLSADESFQFNENFFSSSPTSSADSDAADDSFNTDTAASAIYDDSEATMGERSPGVVTSSTSSSENMVGKTASKPIKEHSGDSAEWASPDLQAAKIQTRGNRELQVEDKEYVELEIEIKSDKEALKDEVKRLRREKKEKFEILTNDFIRQIVTEKGITTKKNFLRPGARTLLECIQQAEDVSVAVKTAKERVKLGRQRVITALRGLFPAVNLEMEESGNSLSGDASSSSAYHFRFEQPVFHGFNLWHTFQQEQANMRGSEAEYDALRVDAVSQVSEAYLEAIRAKAVVQDKIKLSKIVQREVEIGQKKYDAGIVSEIEYLNVESQFSQVELDVEQANQDYELALLDLQRFLGLELTDKIELEPLYDYQSVIDQVRTVIESQSGGKSGLPDSSGFQESLEKYMRLAYDNRPDLKQEVYRLRSNIMAKRAAMGNLLPQLDVTLEFGELAEAFKDDADDPPHIPEWQALMELSWNIGGSTATYQIDHDENAPSVSQFQSGAGSVTNSHTFTFALLDNLRDVYSVREAEIEMLEQFVAVEDTEREMIREVKEAFFNYKGAEVQLKSRVKQLVYREKLAKLNKHKVSVREAESSEYLQAEIDLSSEKEQFHAVMADYYGARVELNRATGVPDLMPVEQWSQLEA